jgi:acyl dehydratase
LNSLAATPDSEKGHWIPFLHQRSRRQTWDEATVGQSGTGQRTFKISEEDILDYNRACGETDPLMVDPAYARKHSPTGELLQHPIFVTTIAFHSLGASPRWTTSVRSPKELP